MGGGEGGTGEAQKQNSCKGKLSEKKIHVRQLTLKKYSCHSLKKIHKRNLIAKKIPVARKFPSQPPPPPPPPPQ